MSLNDRQRLFAYEYAVDGNATQAAIRAGYSERTANVTGSKLLANPSIRALAQEQMRKRQARIEATGDRVALELARIAFSKIDDVMTWDHERSTLVPSEDLPDDVTAAVKEVKATSVTTYTKDGDRQVHSETRIVMHDKGKALDTLIKVLGIQPPDDTPEDTGPRRVRIELDTTSRLAPRPQIEEGD